MMLAQDSWTRKIATAGMLGVAALTPMASAAPPPPAQQVHCVVLDEFPAQSDTFGVSHGTLVEWVLENRSPMACERVQVPLGASMQVLDKLEPGGLEKYVVQRFTVPTRATAEVLAQLVHNQGPTVASQSQGASQSRVLEALWNRAQGSAEFRSYLESELGIAAGSSEQDFVQALVHRVDDLHRGHAEIREARSQLRQLGRDAAQHGVVRVLSAGNQGELSRKLDELGVSVPRNFYLSDLDHGSAIVVGASDHHQTPDPSDDGAARLASPDAGALVGAQGVDVPIVVNGEVKLNSGSSYAQPQVAGLVLGWLHQDPTLTQDTIEQRLLQQARPIPGAEAQIGAGIIDGGWNLSDAPTR